MMAALPGSEPVSIARQDDAYIHAFRISGGTDKPKLRQYLDLSLRVLHHRGLAARWLEVFCYAVAVRLCRCPIDQTNQVTIDGALAQIEMIVRKREDKTGPVDPLWETARASLNPQNNENRRWKQAIGD
jgi:hypothetical protein